MNLFIKQFIIVISSFLIIFWFQTHDDKKQKRERKSMYDKYKFPVLVASIVGLVLNLPNFFTCKEHKIETLTEVMILTPIKKCDKLVESITPTKINKNINKDLSEQDIYTSLPDF